jgi:TatD DNase family protein
VARQVPLERILLETDAPFLAPEGHRGKVNEPGYLLATANVLAEIKKVPLEEVARVTTENCRSLFGFPKAA